MFTNIATINSMVFVNDVQNCLTKFINNKQTLIKNLTTVF